MHDAFNNYDPAKIYPSCSNGNFYVVGHNDNLFAIANYFNVTVQEILNLNTGILPQNIYEGMYLCIPFAHPPVDIQIDTLNYCLNLLQRGKLFKSYPAAVGKKDTPTPKGVFKVLGKQPCPSKEYGLRLMWLSSPELTIHGTNTFKKETKTFGEIILPNNYIVELFNLVPINTVVTVI